MFLSDKATILLAALAVASPLATGAAAQGGAGYCLEPGLPLTDAASLEFIGTSRAAEYDRYFAEAQEYIACLDQTRSAFLELLKAQVETYRAQMEGEHP